MATIKDVAKAAGVSVSTVSRVINQSGYVGEQTQQRVMKALSDLEFAPSSIARGLVSRRTSTVGLLIPDVINPFFADIARGTEDAAIAQGLTVILCNSDWKTEREQMYLDLLRGKWVDGVIVVGSRSHEKTLFKSIGDLPFVLVDRKGMEAANRVWMNHEKGAMFATEHLVSLGCQNLAHVSGPANSPSAVARRKGFLQVARRLRLNYRVVQSDFRYTGGYAAGRELFDGDDRPDGIFAGNDLMAIGIIQAAHQMGMQVPDDVAVVGYDNIATSEYISPSLTTVDQPGYAMGRAAFDMLHRQLQTPDGTPAVEQHEFQPKLILRQSTKRTAPQ